MIRQGARRRHFSLMVLTFGPALLAGCGAGQEVSPPAVSLEWMGGPLTAEVRVPDERLADVRGRVSGYQAEILADGVIEFAEYERATLATVACVESPGVRVMTWPEFGRPAQPGLRLVGRGAYRYFVVAADESRQAEAQAFADGCASEFVSEIQLLWLEGTSLSVQERQSARREVAACLVAEGVAIAEDPTPEELNRVAFPPDGEPAGRTMDPVYEACAAPVIREYGIYTPGASF